MLADDVDVDVDAGLVPARPGDEQDTSAGAPRRAAIRAEFLAKRRRLAAFEFAGLVGFQGFHQIEHALETAEKRVGVEGVRPLLQGVDFEWAHFAGNTMLFLGLVAVMVGYGAAGRARWRTTNKVGWWALLAGLAIQGSHVVEHIVRVSQYLATGELPVGLATQWLDPIWFHFGINLVFLVGLVVGFVGLNVRQDLARPAAPGASA